MSMMSVFVYLRLDGIYRVEILIVMLMMSELMRVLNVVFRLLSVIVVKMSSSICMFMFYFMLGWKYVYRMLEIVVSVLVRIYMQWIILLMLMLEVVVSCGLLEMVWVVLLMWVCVRKNVILMIIMMFMFMLIRLMYDSEIGLNWNGLGFVFGSWWVLLLIMYWKVQCRVSERLMLMIISWMILRFWCCSGCQMLVFRVQLNRLLLIMVVMMLSYSGRCQNDVVMRVIRLFQVIILVCVKFDRCVVLQMSVVFIEVRVSRSLKLSLLMRCDVS